MTRTFNTPTETANIDFEVDGEKFSALPPTKLPANVFIAYYSTTEDGNALTGLVDFLGNVLVDDSKERFLSRLAPGSENPIPLTTLGDIGSYLVGLYATGEEEDAA